MTWGIAIVVFGVFTFDIFGVLPRLDSPGMSTALRGGVYYGSGIAVGFIVVEAFHRLRGR
jgi:hypothetical protein